jgi:hypothetical protein
MMDLKTAISLFVVTIIVDFVFFFIFQALLFNLFRIRKFITTFNVAAILSSIATAGFAWFAFFDLYHSLDMLLFSTFAAITTFHGLSGLYVLVGPACSDRSITTHILIHLSRTPGGELSYDELMDRYNNEVIFQKRYRDMGSVGVIDVNEGKLKITNKGRRIARIYLFFIRALSLKENF